MNDHKKPFTILPYDPNWKSGYKTEQKALRQVFGACLKSIHHIGSTAIVGIMAKPEIDILAVLVKDSFIPGFDTKIQNLGYQVRGECLETGGSKGRYYYSKNLKNIRTHKLHVCQTGHPEIMAKLLFAKYLSDHPLETQEYSKLKLKLSLQYNYGNNITKYTAGKSSFIKRILSQAKHLYHDLHEDDFHQ